MKKRPNWFSFNKTYPENVCHFDIKCPSTVLCYDEFDDIFIIFLRLKNRAFKIIFNYYHHTVIVLAAIFYINSVLWFIYGRFLLQSVHLFFFCCNNFGTADMFECLCLCSLYFYVFVRSRVWSFGTFFLTFCVSLITGNRAASVCCVLQTDV